MLVTDGRHEVPQTLLELRFDATDVVRNQILFTVMGGSLSSQYALVVGGEGGYRVEQRSGPLLRIKIGRLDAEFTAYLTDYPPLLTYVDMTELDGNLLYETTDTRELSLPADRFESWDWTGVDIRKESLWSDGQVRPDSIQAKAADHYRTGGFEIVYFVTRSEMPVQWSKSKELRDRQWDLFVVHHDQERGLLYIHSSDKSSLHDGLAKAVSDQTATLIFGDQVFRALGHITRLKFQNIGVKKHGRRNLRYAMYTGADVAEALSVSQRAGSTKANLSGTGFRSGEQVDVGCSYKGRVWCKDQGPLPRFLTWPSRAPARERAFSTGIRINSGTPLQTSPHARRVLISPARCWITLHCARHWRTPPRIPGGRTTSRELMDNRTDTGGSTTECRDSIAAVPGPVRSEMPLAFEPLPTRRT